MDVCFGYTQGPLLRVNVKNILKAGYGWRGVAAVTAHEMVHWLHFIGFIVASLGGILLMVLFFYLGNYVAIGCFLAYFISSFLAYVKPEYDEMVAFFVGWCVYPKMVSNTMDNATIAEYSLAKKYFSTAQSSRHK